MDGGTPVAMDYATPCKFVPGVFAVLAGCAWGLRVMNEGKKSK